MHAQWTIDELETELQNLAEAPLFLIITSTKWAHTDVFCSTFNKVGARRRSPDPWAKIGRFSFR
jgi:hypothetical protein